MDTVVEEEEDSTNPTLLLAIKDVSNNQLSAELQSNAAQWSKKLEELLNLEAEKAVLRAEGLASKAIQISKQTLATVSSMFVSSESSNETTNFMDQMKLRAQRLFGRKNGFSMDWLIGGDQTVCPVEMMQGDNTECSEQFCARRQAFDQCVNEEIEIVYFDQEIFPIPQNKLEPIVLADNNIIRTFVCARKPSDKEVEEFLEDGRIESHHEKRISPRCGHTVEETRDDSASTGHQSVSAEELISESQPSGSKEAAEREELAKDERHDFESSKSDCHLPSIPERRRSTGSYASRKTLDNAGQGEPVFIRISSHKTSSALEQNASASTSCPAPVSAD